MRSMEDIFFSKLLLYVRINKNVLQNNYKQKEKHF